MHKRAAGFLTIATLFTPLLCAQQNDEPLSVRDKWHNFVHETVNPLLVGAGFFNAGVSRVTNSAPKYGTDSGAFAARFGASTADIASQNFFGDFLFASAFHENPRYLRRGPQYGFWSRVGYAISRAVVIRSDTGADTFNWSNVLGSATSAGLANTYYPPASRGARPTLWHFGNSVLGAGFGNLAPEFWPDFRDKFFKHHH
jgi:hypothetical protein